MALETFRQEDADQMKAIERVLVQAVLPYRESTNPLLVVIALIRMARTVLRLAEKQDQKAIMPVLIGFLQGRVSPPQESSIILPPEFTRD